MQKFRSQGFWICSGQTLTRPINFLLISSIYQFTQNPCVQGLGTCPPHPPQIWVVDSVSSVYFCVFFVLFSLQCSLITVIFDAQYPPQVFNPSLWKLQHLKKIWGAYSLWSVNDGWECSMCFLSKRVYLRFKKWAIWAILNISRLHDWDVGDVAGLFTPIEIKTPIGNRSLIKSALWLAIRILVGKLGEAWLSQCLTQHNHSVLFFFFFCFCFCLIHFEFSSLEMNSGKNGNKS